VKCPLTRTIRRSPFQRFNFAQSFRLFLAPFNCLLAIFSLFVPFIIATFIFLYVVILLVEIAFGEMNARSPTLWPLPGAESTSNDACNRV